MKALLLIGACILALFAIQSAEAYNYAYGGSNTMQYAKPHNSNYQPIYTNSFAKWGARQRGGFFPAIYEQRRPTGYQGNTFKTGSSWGRTYKDSSLQWYYGRGRSDWYYDGVFRVQSDYRMYG